MSVSELDEVVTLSLPRTRLIRIEIRGFRAFGTEPRRLDFDAPLIVVHAGNSQGKSSLAEAVEFLFAGTSSRRELLGGAKAEYNDSLRNAHLPAGDDLVYVAAGVRCPDSIVRVVRRELSCDFGPGTECRTRLLIDDVEVENLAVLGIPLADPPLRAPVLLQHTLRYVLSTEPKQRVAYFKALLSIEDLDRFRSLITETRAEYDRPLVSPALDALRALAHTPFAGVGTRLFELTTGPLKSISGEKVAKILLEVGPLVNEPSPEKLTDLTDLLNATLQAQHEAIYPLNDFAVRSDDSLVSPAAPALESYLEALADADRQAAQLAPIFTAVLTAEPYTTLDHPADCPVCGTTAALTPARLAVLRDKLANSETIDTSVNELAGQLRSTSTEVDRLIRALTQVTPSAANWTPQEVASHAAQLEKLGVPPELGSNASESAVRVAEVGSKAIDAAREFNASLNAAHDAVNSRTDPGNLLTARHAELQSSVTKLQSAILQHRENAKIIHDAVQPALDAQTKSSGLQEFLEVINLRDALTSALLSEARRALVVKRLRAAEKKLQAASMRVLDRRFQAMSAEICRWWDSIRPEELVGFAGVKRRAGGALFVDLTAELRSDVAALPVERNALGVYSDSQLNALGLSTFLARNQLLGSPIVVLDDPIPGSDTDHRLTFVQNTLEQLLDAGVQVVLTTFDARLSEWAQTTYDYRSPIAFQLTLTDPIRGTDPTQTSDVFDRFMLAAEDNLKAPTAHGRRAAAVSYRSAAERLAKQIIATGRTAHGIPTTVADVGEEASLLGDLVPLVCGFAIKQDECGKWRTFSSVLSPGAHDDEVPPPRS